MSTTSHISREHIQGLPPADANTVLIFGGSFDPPHRAHTSLPLHAKELTNADWLMYIPAARSPHKDTGPIASGPQRVEMLKLALTAEANVSVCDVELVLAAHGADAASRPPSYTARTIKLLKDILGERAQLRLLIGADQALAFHKWKDAGWLVEHAPPAVMLRPPNDDADALLKQLTLHWPAAHMEHWRSCLLPTSTMALSATELRTGAVSATDALHPAVASYMKQHELYT